MRTGGEEQMIEAVGGLFMFALVLVGFYAQYRAYERVIAIIERERDEAVREMKVFRGILIPAIAPSKVNAVSEPAKPSALGIFSHLANNTRRTPFRIRFKQSLKAMNSKQVKTDALASALAQQEKSNV